MSACLLLQACDSFEPRPPPTPDPGGFDARAALDLLASAQAAERAGTEDIAHTLYNQSLEFWPVTYEAWAGLERTAPDADTVAVADFFESRVRRYEPLHPRAARMAYDTLSLKPQEDARINRAAARLVAFYDYKDSFLEQQRLATVGPPSFLSRYLIYPVSAISIIAVIGVVIQPLDQGGLIGISGSS